MTFFEGLRFNRFRATNRPSHGIADFAAESFQTPAISPEFVPKYSNLRLSGTSLATPQDSAIFRRIRCSSGFFSLFQTFCRKSTVVKNWWPDPDLNWGHKDFQSSALPTELSGHCLKKGESEIKACGAALVNKKLRGDGKKSG